MKGGDPYMAQESTAKDKVVNGAKTTKLSEYSRAYKSQLLFKKKQDADSRAFSRIRVFNPDEEYSIFCR